MNINKERWPVLRNYVSVKQEGKLRLESGEIVYFPKEESFPAKWEFDGHVALLFDAKTEKVIKDRLLDPLEKLGEKYRIGFWMAERDYPLHTTINAGEPKIPEGDERDLSYLALENDKEIKNLAKTFKGTSLEFNHLIYDGGNVILSSSHIPTKIEDFREFCSDSLKKINFNDKTRKNILHMTLARIKKLPNVSKDELKKILTSYMRDLENLRYSLSKNGEPIKATVEGYFLGKDIIHKKREDL